MSPALKLSSDIALEAMLVVLFLGSLFSLVFGVSLFLGNRWVFWLNERMKRWVSTREAMRPLDVPRSIETHLYRWHGWIGLLLAIGAGFVLYFAFFNYNLRAATQLFQVRTSIWVESLLPVAWWIITVGAVAGLIVGILLAARPGLLRAADAWANRSYSGRRATKPLEIMNFAPDRWIVSSPKLWGGIIVAGSLYVAVVLGYLLIAGT
ncbi:MAG: hypothetical protein A3G27_08920 [Betaproteobacteria bacterium RIFCSPLOWO2_12_FULL_66_14]|nr:MAG: hypothetical protein A3G27_08920 [Betaproteobacteria bacterium RIFCSPLOWO2_12_FULL_66_14]